MRESKQSPAWLPYLLLTVLLAGFVLVAFRLMETARVLSVWLFASKGALQSIDYLLIAVYCVGVLVCLPLLERRLARCETAASMAALALFVFGWQCIAYGALSVLYAFAPTGVWQIACGLLPIGVVLVCIPFVRHR